MNEINRIAADLGRLYEQDCQPFPYAGCRTLLQGAGERMEGFIPDLDLYFTETAGYAEGAKRLKRWNREKAEQAKAASNQSFFEKHPEYNELRDRITPEHTPDLYTATMLHEEMRTKILEFAALFLAHESALTA